ncbi:MAG: winged helix-turn-helix domain-containing protein [Candidatus Hodarchaeales archaeon]|jgi:hypothetical protein
MNNKQEKKLEEMEQSKNKSSSVELIAKETIIEKTRSKEMKIIRPVSNNNSLDELLQGRTLQVYWLLLEKGIAGIREIQKELNYSSPGAVSYQIQKLMAAGLVKKDNETEKYLVSEKVSSGIMNFFFQIKGLFIPRFSIYLCVFLLGFLIYLILSTMWGDPFISHPGSILFLLSLVISTFLSTYESIKMWKMKPNQ